MVATLAFNEFSNIPFFKVLPIKNSRLSFESFNGNWKVCSLRQNISSAKQSEFPRVNKSCIIKVHVVLVVDGPPERYSEVFFIKLLFAAIQLISSVSLPNSKFLSELLS